MQGKILDYNNEFKSGLIRGEDGNKYRFGIDDCKSTITPKVGAEVDFEPNGDKAVEIYVVTKDMIGDIKDIASLATNSTVVAAKATTSKIKKLIPIFIAIIGVIIALIILVNFINEKHEDSKIRELRNGCANDDAKACYGLGQTYYYDEGVFNGEETIGADERSEALAKGCQLGNKDACREGEYYKEGCALQDGESCYILAQNTVTLSSIYSGSYKQDEKNAKEYYQKACQYGYSQGCMK